MAGGTKRLPRAVREQQMLDAAVKVFSENGYREASMDSIAAEAEISKPMLYLYYGSKDELFSACIERESTRFIEAMSVGFDPSLRQLSSAAAIFFYQQFGYALSCLLPGVLSSIFTPMMVDEQAELDALSDVVRANATLVEEVLGGRG